MKKKLRLLLATLLVGMLAVNLALAEDSVTPPLPNNVNATVRLPGFQGSSLNATVISSISTNEYLQTNFTTVNFSGGVGSFSVLVPTNTIWLSVKPDGWLRSKKMCVFSECTCSLKFTNVCGDIKWPADNKVTMCDAIPTQVYFGADLTEHPEYAWADVNGDGVINLIDYTILTGNLGQIGDSQ